MREKKSLSANTGWMPTAPTRRNINRPPRLKGLEKQKKPPARPKNVSPIAKKFVGSGRQHSRTGHTKLLGGGGLRKTAGKKGDLPFASDGKGGGWGRKVPSQSPLKGTEGARSDGNLSVEREQSLPSNKR